MLFRFTAAGESLWQTDPLAFQATRLVLTTAFGYTLANPPTALQGTTIVYDQTIVPGLPKQVVNTNTVRYSHLLDNSIGDFDFGECGLYSGATLVAVGVNPTPISKVAAAGADDGNRVVLNIFLSDSTQDAYGFVRLSNSDDNLALGQIRHVDMLDPPYEREPNTYVVNGLSPSDVPCIAFSDNFGRWNFTSAALRYYEGTISNVDPNGLAVDIAANHNVDFNLAPTNYILQFISGPARGYCRMLTSIGATFFGWSTPTIKAPLVGDQFIIVGPQTGTVNITGQLDIQFQDEGVNLGSAGTVDTINFVGAGVTATRTGDTVEVNIPGATGGGGSSRYQGVLLESNGIWTFNGTANTDWIVTDLYTPPTPPYVTLGTSNLVFAEAGTYRLTVLGSVAMEGESLYFPPGLTSYGVQAAITGVGGVLAPSISAHTRYGHDSSFGPGSNETLNNFAPGLANRPAYRQNWTDLFTVQALVNDVLDLSLFFYTYTGEITEYSATLSVYIEKVGD